MPSKQETNCEGDNPTYRVYDDTTNQAVRQHYQRMRQCQTVASVMRMRQKYGVSGGRQMSVWEAIEALDDFVDVSDPDVDLPNLVHLFQTAEGLRADGHPRWLQLTGLIHDLGKMIYLRGCDEDGTSVAEQWGIVGDTFVVGCELPECLVFPEFSLENPDRAEGMYRGELGMYQPGCGLDACLVAYGHDEYMYEVLKRSPGVRLPPEALAIVRYHSLYPWHQGGAYASLENERDREMKPWVQLFNRYDLYTKHNTTYTEVEMTDLKTYYGGLIQEFLPEKLDF